MAIAHYGNTKWVGYQADNCGTRVQAKQQEEKTSTVPVLNIRMVELHPSLRRNRSYQQSLETSSTILKFGPDRSNVCCIPVVLVVS